MSGFQVIAQAGEEIRNIFSKALKNAGLGSGDPSSIVSLAPPAKENERTLSLWLYLVTENEHVRNRPNIVEKDGVIRPPPLALTLYYLATPGIASNSDGLAADEAISNSAKVLGVVLQTLHARPVVALDKAPNGNSETTSEQLHLSLCRLSIEDLARIWEALDHPYRLSICFKVNIVRIESLRQTIAKPVTEREFITGRLKQNASR
ncbi:DUF4255 domain-containing protein [Rhizobium ruizarguesonis]|uniref:DUF4255 domain-containing protein n=1 Tax=Rhizobium TaxID=379 RepID=UPI00048279BD|nr:MULTISPECIES: DUF4255 domain-containing protein [Rhizobium]MBC2802367.1 DUF4255 domain-containing protein [Rhizobium ruizarguesonis]